MCNQNKLITQKSIYMISELVIRPMQRRAITFMCRRVRYTGPRGLVLDFKGITYYPSLVFGSCDCVLILNEYSI
jgi:hypothetical protein